jgi:copper chaperone CopZ
MRAFPFVLLLAGAMARAEFLEVHLEVNQMDCAACVASLEIAFKKIRGVSKVAVIPEKGAEFTLQPGNRVTLERLRDTIKGVGFTPARASVVVKGKPLTLDGQWRFEVEGIGKTYTLNANDEATIRKLRGEDGKVITVRAVSPAPPDPRTLPALQVSEILNTP